MIRRIFTLLMLVAVALGLAACAAPKVSGTTEERETRDIPEWSMVRPTAEGYIYGVGQAKKQNPSLAKTVAAQRAREEVAAALSTKVESLVKDFMEESGVGDRARALEFTQVVSKGVTDATLNGALIKEVYQAKDGTFFVMVEYSLDDAHRAALETARAEEALFNEFKAEQGFEDLERELAKLR